MLLGYIYDLYLMDICKAVVEYRRQDIEISSSQLLQFVVDLKWIFRL